MVFNFDWWFGSAFHERVFEAKRRCAMDHFPELDPDTADEEEKYSKFFDELEARTIVYLRDGFSYEVKDIIHNPTTTTLTFECTSADEAYKVGSFVVTVPFEEVVRVEVFAVHPSEKPEDMPSIKGFGTAQAPGTVPSPPSKRPDDRQTRQDGD